MCCRGRLGHQHGGRLLDHLLVTALDRALAVEEWTSVAVAVRQDLDLDVARRAQVALQEDLVRAEGARRLAPGRGHRVVQLVGGAHEAHAPAPAAGRRLDQQRVADAWPPRAASGGRRRGPSGTRGSTGTPAPATASLAWALLPMTRIASGAGPTQTMPAGAHASGSAGFSDKKP